jgi:hypothetical protein
MSRTVRRKRQWRINGKDIVTPLDPENLPEGIEILDVKGIGRCEVERTGKDKRIQHLFLCGKGPHYVVTDDKGKHPWIISQEDLDKEWEDWYPRPTLKQAGSIARVILGTAKPSDVGVARRWAEKMEASHD